MNDCRQLLADFAQTRSEPAFREIVTRYLNLVYSSALRLVDGDAHRAQDVAQVVFADLADKAGELPPEIMLGGWLHRHACFVAANTMRGERRRLARESEAVEMNSLHENAGADFSRLAPLLDETINQLDEADRAAILLRFFEQQDFRSVGQSFASSEDAARMRVNRALDKLRDLLAQRGIRTTAGALAAVIAVNAVQSAPAGLATTISTAAVLTGTAVSASTLVAATKTIAMTTLQKTLVTAALATTIGAGIFEAHQAAQLRGQNRSLQQQQAPLAAQIRQLQQERAAATNQLADMQVELATANRNNSELLKLRGEIGALRQQAGELGGLRQANQKLLAQLAAQSGSTNRLTTEDEYILHQTHAVDAMGTLLDAFKKYTARHNGQYPGSFDQLTTSGDLVTTNFAGNLGLDDFELVNDGTVDLQSNKVIISLRVPIKRIGWGSVMVRGGISDDGSTHTETLNISE